MTFRHEQSRSELRQPRSSSGGHARLLAHALTVLWLAGCTGTRTENEGESGSHEDGTGGAAGTVGDRGNAGTSGGSGKAGTSGGAGSGSAGTNDEVEGSGGSGAGGDDAGDMASAGDAGNGGSGEGGMAGDGTSGMGGTGGSAECIQAKKLWFEDWELGNHSRWTGSDYGNTWGNDCQGNGLSTVEHVSGSTSMRGEIVCPYTVMDNVQRAYGGLQFDGDERLPGYTNTGAGIDAPFGIVNTFWVMVDTDTVFTNGSWLSLFTASGSCDWSDPVITLGIEDASDRLASAHYLQGAGGERVFAANTPTVPRHEWTRITVYLNYHTNEMLVWEDGEYSSRTTFDRQLSTICHFHWGLYASGDNDDIALYEDDNVLWKLLEEWDSLDEPYLGADVSVCD